MFGNRQLHRPHLPGICVWGWDGHPNGRDGPFKDVKNAAGALGLRKDELRVRPWEPCERLVPLTADKQTHIVEKPLPATDAKEMPFPLY